MLCENVVVIHENTKYLCKNNSFAKESNFIYFFLCENAIFFCENTIENTIVFKRQ